MFTYFHCYYPETWEAQKKCGLIDEHAGVRFMQTATLPEELKFNNLAAKGSSFYNMMLENRLPMYIDRLHGGVVFEDYKFFVNLTGNSEFCRNHRCISVEETPEILKNLLPCEVSGGVHWFVNKTADGWLLVMFNNSGIERSVERGEYILPEGMREATVRLKNGQKLNILEGAKDIHFENDTYHIELQPGAWLLAKFI